MGATWGVQNGCAQTTLPKMEVSRKGKKPEELDGVPECGSWKRVVPEHQKKSDGWLTEVFNRMSGVVLS